MNIIVCVKQVPNTNEVKINKETGTLIREGVESIINPDDKNALEAALALKEQIGGKVTLLSMGPAQAKAALKEGKITLTAIGDGETVTGQLPAAGQSVLPGSEVLVYLGEPTQERRVTVPDFTGMNRQQASQAAGQLGLSIIPIGSDAISANVTVCSQKEPAGTELAVGSAVTLQFADTTARD